MMAKQNDAAADVAQAQPMAAAPAVAIRVRFAPPGYPGKNPAVSRNVADAVLIGVFGERPLELAGFTLAQRAGDGQIVVFAPRTAPLQSAPEAIQPRRVKAPDGIETDSADGTIPATGAKQALDGLRQSLRDAWARANAGGVTQWGAEIPLG